MNDSAKIGFYYDTPKQMEKVLAMNIFEKRKQDFSKMTGEPIEICSLKNMQTTFYLHSRYVRLTGSLIKFTNYNTPKEHISPEYLANCTLSDLHYSTDYISSLFAMHKREMKVTGLEFSLTTAVPEKPFFYMEGLNNIRLKPYYYLPPPRNYPQPLEKYCPFIQYTVKCYDWGAWNSIKGNFLRWEIAFKKMQKIKELTRRKQITVSDLTDKQFQRNMADFAIKTLQDTDKQLLIDCSALQPKEMMLYYAGKDTKFWENLKKHNQDTYKKIRADYLRLCKQIECGGYSPYRHLENLLKLKFECLLSN